MKPEFHDQAGVILNMVKQYAASLMRKSRIVTAFLEAHMAGVCAAWFLLTMSLAIFRLADPSGAVHKIADIAPVILAYGLIIAAPVIGFLLARHSFQGRSGTEQPSFRFAILGRWRQLDLAKARSQPVFGPVGFMTSLLVGMLLNVVVRTIEFFTAVPAVSVHAPAWAQMMFAYMALDVIVTGFFYTVAFVMALRTVPLFPRMLLFAWLMDVAMQLLIARQLGMIGGVPNMVVEPLLTLLNGNITKVLISSVIWLPYLLLSERVNVTYRHRTDRRLKAPESPIAGN